MPNDDDVNEIGLNAIQDAAFHADTETFQRLLKQGHSITNSFHANAAHYAVSKLHGIPFLDPKTDPKAYQDYLTHYPQYLKNVSAFIVQNHLEKALNQPDIDGLTPFGIAVQSNRGAAVEILLQFHVDVNQVCAEQGLTPLQLAVQQHNSTIVELLVHHGASLQIHHQGKPITEWMKTIWKHAHAHAWIEKALAKQLETQKKEAPSKKIQPSRLGIWLLKTIAMGFFTFGIYLLVQWIRTSAAKSKQSVIPKTTSIPYQLSIDEVLTGYPNHFSRFNRLRARYDGDLGLNSLLKDKNGNAHVVVARKKCSALR